nr:endoribonuclease Dcr-1-like [Danaus plexippus plexippus]
MSSSLAKPKEVIIEYSPRTKSPELPADYIQLEEYMRESVKSALDFINEHRYDPTEIYGEDMYEEFKNIPDPTLEPKAIFKQFLYVLDQLGPYAADKAAFSLLIKLEKLKIKVPYERHFLLLCVCTSVFVKIRCYTDSVLSKYDNDWEKITTFLTPKMLRLAEILEQFYQNESSDKAENEKDTKNCIEDKVEDNVNKVINDNLNRDNTNDVSDQSHEAKADVSKTNELLNEIEKCDFVTLGNKIEDRVHMYEANLKDYEENYMGDKVTNSLCSVVENRIGESDIKVDDSLKTDNVIDVMSESPKFKRQGHRSRGRGRVSRVNKVQMQANPDALCGIVFVKEPLMAKILFMLIVDLSRSRPTLSHLCAQYCTDEGDAREHRRHEEVLKKFRMHECNLLLATSVLEEGIDLPRCNLVVRWDLPPSYRSHALCRGRARACRAAVTLLSKAETHTDRLLHHLAIYRELDQIITRKCGCGIQYEPPQEEEHHADTVAFMVKSYTPLENKVKKLETIESDDISDNVSPCLENSLNDTKENVVLGDSEIDNCITENEDCTKDNNSKICQDSVTENDVNIKALSEILINGDKDNLGERMKDLQNKIESEASIDEISEGIANIEVKDDSDVNKTLDFRENDKKLENVKYEYKIKSGNDETLASVDLNTAIALINRYCGKLPSDTFTRLTPQWRTERVILKDRRGEPRDAYVCTLRMPLNCPVKFNIVGHPMPTRSLARRMAALLASRALHRAGELDDQLLPIGKENFKAAEMENINLEESGENARPGTTKRRQYYYKRTASAFTNCRPVVEYTDEDIEKKPHTCDEGKVDNETRSQAEKLYNDIPTETKVVHLVGAIQNADLGEEARETAAVLLRSFMEFVFSDVLRVRRRGMKLADTTHNNYYVVPTVKKTTSDGATWIDIDWPFLDLIYQHTEEKRCLEIEKPMLWEEEKKKEEKKGKKIENPLLKPGEVFVFDAEKYKEAVVTPWYRNQDQPQFFLVAEICWNLTPESSFPSAQHASFRSYYKSKYGAELTQSNQPLLDVDHTSARLNLLTPRYVNRKGVALPVSSERTRRAKRDRLDQKQILVAELCMRHPFAAPLWCAAVALPCALYRINALLLADEVRRAVSRDVGVGQPRDDISWPPLDFGWSLAEVLSADSDKGDKKKENEMSDCCSRDGEKESIKETEERPEVKEKTINDILQEKEDAENGFEIGTWSNDMASSIPLDELMEPLPPNVTFCTSSSGEFK